MGAMGGAYPYRASPRLYLRPPAKSRTRSFKEQTPLGAMGTKAQCVVATSFVWSLWGQGNQGPEAPWPPLGGEIHSREGSHRGVGVSPLPVPYVCPSQDGPPISGVLGRMITT